METRVIGRRHGATIVARIETCVRTADSFMCALPKWRYTVIARAIRAIGAVHRSVSPHPVGAHVPDAAIGSVDSRGDI